MQWPREKEHGQTIIQNTAQKTTVGVILKKRVLVRVMFALSLALCVIVVLSAL